MHERACYSSFGALSRLHAGQYSNSKATSVHPLINASSQVEQLFQLRHRVFGVFHSVPNGSRIFEYFEIVAALECLVAEEVDGCVVDAARHILFVLDVLQAVSFIPALRENIEGDLTADRVAICCQSANGHLRVEFTDWRHTSDPSLGIPS